jgi:hypothetical protein
MAKRLGHMDLVELLLEHGAHDDEASALGLRDINGSEVTSNTPMNRKDGGAELELEMEAYSFLDEYIEDSSVNAGHK